LQTYLDSRIGWSGEQKRQWLASNRWLIIGFCMPFSLMNVVPVLGGLGAALAQASVTIGPSSVEL
jgi:hypothetical protein